MLAEETRVDTKVTIPKLFGRILVVMVLSYIIYMVGELIAI